MKVKKSKIGIFLILLLYVMKSHAAIVSDNDGSAFVTKSEFEALKNNFAQQIDNYNDSIDSKIDGAIASYLAGIELQKTEEQVSLLNKINSSCDDSYISGTTEVKYGYRCMAKSYSVPTTQKPQGAVVNLFMGNMLLAGGETAKIGGGWARMAMDTASRTGLFDVNVPSSGVQNGIYLMLRTYNGKLYADNLLDNVQYFYYVSGSGGANDSSGWPAADNTDDTVLWTFPQFKIEDNYWKINIGDVNIHWNSASGGSYDNIKTFYGPTYKRTESINVLPIVGKITNSVVALKNSNLTKMTLQENSYDWTLYGVQNFFTWKNESGTWRNDRALKGNSTPTTTFYFNCHPYETVTLSNLIDYDATVALNQDNTNVAIYGGLPIFKATNNGEVTMKIKFKSYLNHDVRIGLKKSQFANDETYTIDASLGLRNENDVKYTTNKFTKDTEYTFKMDVNKDDVVWIKTYDDSSDIGFTGAVTSSIILVSD